MDNIDELELAITGGKILEIDETGDKKIVKHIKKDNPKVVKVEKKIPKKKTDKDKERDKIIKELYTTTYLEDQITKGVKRLEREGYISDKKKLLRIRTRALIKLKTRFPNIRTKDKKRIKMIKDYRKNNKSYRQEIGTPAQVFRPIVVTDKTTGKTVTIYAAYRTKGWLLKDDILKNKHGRYVNKHASEESRRLYDEAMIEFKKIEKANPDDPEKKFDAANYWVKDKRPKAAKKD